MPGIFTKRAGCPVLLGALFLLLLACAAMQGGGSIQPPAVIPGAEFVGMETCAACHAETVRDFRFARHAKLMIPLPDGQNILGCESCHGAGSLHVEAGGGRGAAIINPGQNPSACYQCHPEVQAFFNLQYHHPTHEQGLSCNSCHSPHGEDILLPEGRVVGRHNAPCNECHQDQSRPFVFEHEALREGCTVCHNHHGSINDKMLVANDNNLCLRCHAQISAPGDIELGGQDHSTRLAQGTCWSGGCHTAVHGSNMNSHLRY